MKQLFLIGPLLAAAPAFAHDAGGVVHLHPHGGEALLLGLALVAAVGAWMLARR